MYIELSKGVIGLKQVFQIFTNFFFIFLMNFEDKTFTNLLSYTHLRGRRTAIFYGRIRHINQTKSRGQRWTDFNFENRFYFVILFSRFQWNRFPIFSFIVKILIRINLVKKKNKLKSISIICIPDYTFNFSIENQNKKKKNKPVLKIHMRQCQASHFCLGFESFSPTPLKNKIQTYYRFHQSIQLSTVYYIFCYLISRTLGKSEQTHTNAEHLIFFFISQRKIHLVHYCSMLFQMT